MFLDAIDKDIEVLNPEDTRLVPDESSPPMDDNLYIGHRAAMDPVLYQLDPAIQALQQPRPGRTLPSYNTWQPCRHTSKNLAPLIARNK